MKIEKTVKVTKCDLCGNVEEKNWGEFLWTEYQCLGCGKDICTECVHAGRAIEYSQSFNFTDSEVYCKECDKKEKLAHTGLHKAFHNLALLVKEEERFKKGLEKRVNVAEKRLGKLIKQRRKRIEKT